VKIGEFNLGIREGDTVSIHFDEKYNTFYFQGRLPNNFVWLKTMRLFTATEKAGFDRESLGNASTFASIVQQNRLGAKYGFEIHIHTYFINKILPEMLRHDFGEGIKRANEYQDTIKDVEGHLNRAKTAASDTQGTQIGKSYASDYEEARKDYEALTKEWQDIAQKYQKELQELNRLATHANAVIFTISLSSDVKIVPDGSAVALALSECLDELNMRCETVLRDTYLQHFSFREVRQPYFFFMTELAGVFNPVMLALKASDPYFLELFKGLFPNLNAASVLQSNLENMRHLQSLTPSEILRKMLLQMEIGTSTFIPPPMTATVQGFAQSTNEPPPRFDNLNVGILIGHDLYQRPVKIDFENLHRHIMVEGLTETGKSTFSKLLVCKAIESGLKVIVMDTGYRWTTLIKRHNSIIFDKELNVEAALNHDYSLCIVEKGKLESIENKYLQPFFQYIINSREKQMITKKDILLVIDEAHNFSRKLRRGALVDIMTEIGKHGVIVALISQRDENVGKDARMQTSLQFNTQVSHQYIGDYSDTYRKDIAEAMMNIGLFNLYVHGNDIKRHFEMKPLEYEIERIRAEKMLSDDKEREKYCYKGFESAPNVEVKQEPASIMPDASKIEIKQEPPKPPEPEKPKDELSEIERKAVEALKVNGGMYESSSKWFKAIGIDKTGETTQKIERSLEEKGYVVFEKVNPTKKIIKLTENGKAK
jgi:hypothetical protein